MAHKWEIYKDKAGEFRVRFKYNSEVMFSTEGYSSKQSALNALASAQKNMPTAPTDDNTGVTKPKASNPVEKAILRNKRTRRKPKEKDPLLEAIAEEERLEARLETLTAEKNAIIDEIYHTTRQHIEAMKRRIKIETKAELEKQK